MKEGWRGEIAGETLRNFEEVESERCDTGKFGVESPKVEEAQGGRVRIVSEDIHMTSEGENINFRKDSKRNFESEDHGAKILCEEIDSERPSESKMRGVVLSILTGSKKDLPGIGIIDDETEKKVLDLTKRNFLLANELNLASKDNTDLASQLSRRKVTIENLQIEFDFYKSTHQVSQINLHTLEVSQDEILDLTKTDLYAQIKSLKTENDNLNTQIYEYRNCFKTHSTSNQDQSPDQLSQRSPDSPYFKIYKSTNPEHQPPPLHPNPHHPLQIEHWRPQQPPSISFIPKTNFSVKNYENKISEFEQNLNSLSLGENHQLKDYATHLHHIKIEHRSLLDLSKNLHQLKRENLVKVEQKVKEIKAENAQLGFKEPGSGERKGLDTDQTLWLSNVVEPRTSPGKRNEEG